MPLSMADGIRFIRRSGGWLIFDTGWLDWKPTLRRVGNCCQPLCGPCMAAKVVFPGSNKSFSGALTRTFGHAKTAAAVIPRPYTPQL